MIKKYNYKIAGIASFAGITMNNVKADNNQKVHLKVGNIVYCNDNDGLVNLSPATDLEQLFGIISTLGQIKKNGTDEETKLDFADSEKKYFIEKVKIGNDDANKLSDASVINISAEKGNVEITLVPKRERIKFTYTGAKELTTAAEDELLKLIVQGKNIQNVKLAKLIKDHGNKLGGFELEDNTGKVVGKEIKIFENTPCKLTINSAKIDKDICKKVVCKFAEEVEKKLVTAVKLDNLYNAPIDEIIKKTKGKEVLEELNKIKIDDTNNSFFKGSFEILKEGDNGKKLTAGDSAVNTALKDASFIVLNGIKEENINPIFLKKTFTVELDSNEINKTIVDDVKKFVEDKLKGKFEDTVVLDVKGIVDFLKAVHKSEANDIFVATAFNDLSNVADIEGVELNVNKFDGNSKVNASAIKIKLKSAAFVATNIKTTIKLTLTNIGNQTRGDKTLKSAVKTAIEKIFNDIKTAISKADFVGKFNDSNSGIQLADANNKFAETDFEFSPKPTGDIDKDTNVTLKKEFWDKLNDSCFEVPQKPKENENDKTNSSEGSGDQNGDDKHKKKCCNSGKNN